MNIDGLLKCYSYEDIDEFFKNIEIDLLTEQKIVLIYNVLGITQSFSCPCDNRELSVEEEYSFAKQQLIFMNERKNKNGEVLI